MAVNNGVTASQESTVIVTHQFHQTPRALGIESYKIQGQERLLSIFAVVSISNDKLPSIKTTIS